MKPMSAFVAPVRRLVPLALVAIAAISLPRHQDPPPPLVGTGAMTCVQWCSDLAAARGFYERVLGCSTVRDLAAVGYVELRAPIADVRFGLARRDPAQAASGGGTTLTFHVADIEAASARLKAHGVTVSTIDEMPGLVRLARFTDPDGNPLQLAQPLGDDPAGVLAPVAFLRGTWRSTRGQRMQEETWGEPLGGSMLGCGRTVQNGKTVFHEFLRIEATKDGLVYHAAIPGQAPIAFPMVEHGAGTVAFENPQHDFPTRIAYRLDDYGPQGSRILAARNSSRGPFVGDGRLVAAQ